MPDKFDRFDAYLARKQAQQRRSDKATPSTLLTAQAPLTAQRQTLTTSATTPADAAEHPRAIAEQQQVQICPNGQGAAHAPTTDASITATPPAAVDLAATAPLLQSRHDSQWRRDLQILALHQKMLEKLQQQPSLVPEFLDKLEQRKLHGRIRHGEYLFWYCALSQWQHQAQAISSLLSMEPGPRKYRRRTLLAGLLTEPERQQILLGLTF